MPPKGFCDAMLRSVLRRPQERQLKVATPTEQDRVALTDFTAYEGRRSKRPQELRTALICSAAEMRACHPADARWWEKDIHCGGNNHLRQH